MLKLQEPTSETKELALTGTEVVATFGDSFVETGDDDSLFDGSDRFLVSHLVQ